MLYGVEPVDDGVAVCRVQLFERCGCGGIGRQCLSQIGRDLRVSLSSVGSFPAPLLLGSFYGSYSGWPHPAGLSETGDMFDVSCGPKTVRTARGEALAIAVVVTSSNLSVDPTETQRFVKRLSVGKRCRLSTFLVQYQPDPGMVGMVNVQPGMPGLCIPDKKLL